MRKFLPYIFIGLILLGFLGPVKQVQAADPVCNDAGTNTPCTPVGTCSNFNEGGIAPRPKITSAECGLLGGNTWDRTTPLPPPAGSPAGTPSVVLGTCNDIDESPGYKNGVSEDECKNTYHGNWTSAIPGASTAPAATGSELEKNIKACGTITAPLEACLIKIAYIVFNQLPSFVLNLAARFLNMIMALTLSNTLYGATFIKTSWVIIRDLSNIFFIIVLLYIAIRMILGLGGHDTKKMVAQVIIMALLINFSMFFTKVIIDTSNVLALVFYNKIEIKEIDSKGVDRELPYTKITNPAKIGLEEKDIALGLAKAFKPGDLLTEEFFNKARTQTQELNLDRLSFYGYLGTGAYLGSFGGPIYGTAIGAGIGVGTYFTTKVIGYFVAAKEIPTSMMLGIILSSGAVMAYAAWSFAIAGLSFLARIIELWALIIFSPFAFMSSTLPLLSHVEDIGWEAWSKRLLKVSFMAPVFMFFLYFIFLLINSNLFTGFLDRPDFKNQGTIEAMLIILLPTLLVLRLLKEATKFAEKAAGSLGESMIKIGGIATGLVVGGGLGLAAKGLQTGLGEAGKRVFEDASLAKSAASGNRFAQRLRSIAGGDDGKGGMAGSSFDLRQGVAGGVLKTVGAATGLNLGAQSKLFAVEAGGHMADLEKQDQKRKKIAEGLKVKEVEPEKQHLNHLKEQHQEIALRNEHAIHEKDQALASAEASVTVLKNIADSHVGSKKQNDDGTYQDPEYKKKLEAYNVAANKVKGIKDEKSAIKNGSYDSKKGNYRTDNLKITRQEVIDANLGVEDAEVALTDAEKVLAKATLDEAAAKTAKAAALTELSLAATPETIKAAKEKADKATEDADAATKNTAKATEKLSDAAQDYANKEAWAKQSNTAALNGFGNSQNDYEDKFIPEAEHHIKEENDHRRLAFADSEEAKAWFWNRDSIRKTTHEIRMGVKPEKGHGGSHAAGGHFAEGLLAEAIGSKLFHSSPKADHGDTHAPAADHGGDAGGHAAPTH